RRGERVDVLLGPAELERDDPRRWPWPAPAGFVVAPAPAELLARVRGAAAFAGNDSGPTHLAAMAGVPAVAVFGPGRPGVFAPNGPRAEVLLAPQRELARLEPGAVLAALDR